MKTYERLTPAEQKYLAQDGVSAADVNVVEELWTIVDYLTPLYSRFSHDWYSMVRRVTDMGSEDATNGSEAWEMPSFLENIGHQIGL